MTPEKIIEIVDRYSDEFQKNGIAPARSVDPRMPDDVTRLRHASWMCLEVVRMVADGKVEKAMRWLGFVQGAMWSTGFRTIDEMRHDNMPAGEEFRERKVEPAAKLWHVRVSVSRGNGQHDIEEVTVEGTRADAELDLWSLLDGLGVETAIWEDGEQ